MKKLYVSAPVDEVQLAGEVMPMVRDLGGRLPEALELREVAARRGMDVATMLLYQAICAAPVHARFIHEVDAQPVQRSHAPIDDKVLFIPALFHGHYPETGADAKLALGIARACGFQADTIPVRSVTTVTENADIVAGYLANETAKRLWIFAVSKGSAEFRVFMQRHPHAPALARIAGWINACGLPAGCQIADRHLATPLRRLTYRLICRLFGSSIELVRELSTSHRFWQSPLVVPGGMRVINFAAIPLGCHIQTSLVGRYSAISAQGPNDGMVSCRDSIVDGGVIYPVWGCDHFFRGPQVVPLLYRFFSWLRLQQPDTHRP
jgi:hypothetical protein